MKSIFLTLGNQLFPIDNIKEYKKSTFFMCEDLGLKGSTKKFKIIFHNQGFISITLGSPKNFLRYFLKALVVGSEGDPSCTNTNTTFVFLFGCV